MEKRIHTKCQVEGCTYLPFKNKSGNDQYPSGYCRTHYHRHIKNRPLNDPEPPPSKCKIDGCARLGVITKRSGNMYYPNGYCCTHDARIKKYGDPNYVTVILGENRAKHPLYNIFSSMRGRCCNTNDRGYKNYGGRGIKVCDRWLGKDGFSNFLSDMGEKPTPKHSLDRIDVNGNYEPSNCRWATPHEQAANKRNKNKQVGVFYDPKSKRYRAMLEIKGVRRYFGSHKKFNDAVRARKEAEIKYLNQ